MLYPFCLLSDPHDAFQFSLSVQAPYIPVSSTTAIAFLDGAAGAFLSPFRCFSRPLHSLVYPFISDSSSIGTSLCSSSLRRHWNARIYLEHFNGSCLRYPCSPCFNFSLRFPVLCATRRCLILKSRPLIPDTGLKPLNRHN
jgi:hypothetical protein